MNTIGLYTPEWTEMRLVAHFAIEQAYAKQLKYVILNGKFDTTTSHYSITCAIQENDESYGKIVVFDVLKIIQPITAHISTMFSMRKHFNTNKYALISIHNVLL